MPPPPPPPSQASTVQPASRKRSRSRTQHAVPAASNAVRAKRGTPTAGAPDYTVTHVANKAVARVWVGDTRELLPKIPEVAAGTVDLVFADPPFNWNRAYDKWDDALPREDYLDFTRRWIDLCAGALRPGGSFWINIPDDTAAEIVLHLKNTLKFEMENWCIWHYRFGQNTTQRFINSKVHALWFVKPGAAHTWNRDEVLEISDRAAIYEDPRTMSKRDGVPAGKRVPMDVWYGKFWGRVQGNSRERRHYHDNQLPEVYLERVVRACSNPGDTVLDPFLGSGTTGVISHALGRHFIGTEFSPANAKLAVERIKAGPIRLGAGLNQSSAIFPHRRKSQRRAPNTAD